MKVNLRFIQDGYVGQIKISSDLYDTSNSHSTRYAKVTIPTYSYQDQNTFIYSCILDESLPYETITVPNYNFNVNQFTPTFNFCEFEPISENNSISTLDTINLELDPKLYDKLSVLSSNEEKLRFLITKFRIKNRQSIIYSKQFLDKQLCFVAWCQDKEFGIIDLKKTNIVITKAPRSFNSTTKELHQNLNDSKISTLCLPYPISSKSIIPQRDINFKDDDTLFAFATHDMFVKLKISSGAEIQLISNERSTRLRLFVLLEPNNFNKSRIYLHPRVKSLYPTSTDVIVKKLINDEKLPIAEKVILSRVGEWNQTQRLYQDIILQNLKKFFASKRRVLKVNDLIPITFNKSLVSLISEDTELPGDFESMDDLFEDCDTLVWFKIISAEAGVGSDDITSSGNNYMEEIIVDPVNTKLITSNIVMVASKTTNNPMYKNFYGLSDMFIYDPIIFPYSRDLSNIIKSSFECLERNIPVETFVLLNSTSPNVGKSTLTRSIANNFRAHLIEFDCVSFSVNKGSVDSITKTVGFLKAKLEAILPHIDAAILYMSHLDVLFPPVDPNQDPNTAKVSRLLELGLFNCIQEVMKRYRNVIFVASVNQIENLSNNVRSFFKFEINVPVPTEVQRLSIFQWLLTSQNLTKTINISSLDTRSKIHVEEKIDISYLAVHSAGLTPLDIESIVKNAIEQAIEEESNSEVVITMSTLERAISSARDEYSVSIGAPKIPNITWEDIGGIDQIKDEIMDTIDMPLKHPELFSSGMKKRSGLLFYGPPGTGKTLMAKAIASNFSLNFFSVKGPELLNMYIGESEANVRRIFQRAREAKPCVIFFDEIDSVAPKRGNQGDSGGVMDRIVSQLLAELDGMSSSSGKGDSGSEGIFVIGATNRPDLLDEALLRPGRFDKLLYLGIPDTDSKQLNILKALTRKFTLASNVDLSQIAQHCPFNYTGADFYALCSDAMLKAMTRIAHTVDEKLLRYNELRQARQENSVSLNYWFDQISTEEDTAVIVSMEDFINAQNELVCSVSQDELNHYLKVKHDFEG